MRYDFKLIASTWLVILMINISIIIEIIIDDLIRIRTTIIRFNIIILIDASRKYSYVFLIWCECVWLIWVEDVNNWSLPYSYCVDLKPLIFQVLVDWTSIEIFRQINIKTCRDTNASILQIRLQLDKARLFIFSTDHVTIEDIWLVSNVIRLFIK